VRRLALARATIVVAVLLAWATTVEALCMSATLALSPMHGYVAAYVSSLGYADDAAGHEGGQVRMLYYCSSPFFKLPRLTGLVATPPACSQHARGHPRQLRQFIERDAERGGELFRDGQARLPVAVLKLSEVAPRPGR
jgi:hypothetical protein